MKAWAVFVVTLATTVICVTGAARHGVPLVQFGSIPQPDTSAGTNGLGPSQYYHFHEELNGDFSLYWDFNETHVTFETIVKTNGWVGFGISPKGAMASSDVVIGWVSNGQVHFSDRHAEGHFMPAKDAQQDWTLLMGLESGEYTVLKMTRKFDTCDDKDVPILEGTTRVIYAYNLVDPTSDDSITYHGTNRGTKSLLLRDPPASEQNNNDLPSDVKVLEFRNRNVSVPSTDTTYWCTMWKLPNLGGKHHMIRYEPIIQAGHETLLHHVLLYYCSGNIQDPTYHASDFTCYENPPSESHRCNSVLIAWAIGGKVFNYPAHTGYSLGGAGDPGYFMMETHYDNPGMRSDFVDNSGLRLYLTSQLRQYDAAVLSVGVHVDDKQIIPPYESSFLSRGYCHENCLTDALQDQEIHVIANLLHAHVIGVKLRTRHFRNGIELAPIQEDNNYDFDYQETRMLPSERVIKKGDSLLVECEYDSTQRTTVTYGGLSSREEMCLSFLVYYPRYDLAHCETRIQYDVPPEFAGRSVHSIVENLDWTKQGIHEEFKKVVMSSPHNQLCHGSGHQYPSHYTTVRIPEVTNPFQRPQMCPA